MESMHMCLVSTVSQQLMDRCEVERNPISLAAVQALGDAHWKCWMQMYYSLALITKGSVRTLVRSVEESNGAEAWRLIHNRYAPDTQNRQYALMQKIMMLAKLWCDHAERFESGFTAWGLDVGEFGHCVGRCCQMTPIFFDPISSWVHTPTVPLFEQICCNGVALPETLEQIRPCQLEMGQVRMMTTGCKLSLSRNVRERAKANTKTRKEIARTTQATRAIQTSTRARTVAELDIGRKIAGDQVEKPTTMPPVTTAAHRVAIITRKAKAKANKWALWKRISPLKQPQPCRIFHKHSIMGVTINAVSSTRRQADAEYLLLDSGAQLHACPIKYPGQKVPLLDPGIHIASGARLQHDGGRLVTIKLPEGRTIRVLFHACEVQKPILSAGCLAQQEYWSVLRADT